MEFVHPSCHIVAGGTGCGKTYYIKNIIEKNCFNPPLEKVIICYSIFQPLYNEIKTDIPIEFIEGLDFNASENTNVNTLIFIDDLVREAVQSPKVLDLFTRGSHHLNKSVLLTTQNLYEKGLRTLNLNAQYLTLCRQARGLDQIEVLGRQLGVGKFLLEVFKDATLKPYSCLLISLHPKTPEELRYTRPGDPIIVYTPKK